MNLELHILQNFAPSNLNRDDTGSPKSCDFGGYRRARISSQAIKRAMRAEFKTLRDKGLLPEDAIADRTKRLVSEVISPRLQEELNIDAASSERMARTALAAVGGFTDKETDPDPPHKDNLTQYLFFIAPREVDTLVALCLEHSADLEKAFPDIYGEDGKKKVNSRDAKKKAYDRLRRAVGKQAFETLQQRLDGGRSVDLALFGRMLADLPAGNRDAASQIAHAISTHQVSFDFDYYTAVDDRKPDDTAGADMIGTVEFNSACYYRHANIDLGLLRENLGGGQADPQLVTATVRAFLQASRDAIPTGKQNSFAARNLPSFVFAVVRDSGFCSLANAFVQPAKATSSEDLVQVSINRLAQHWEDLSTMYGPPATDGNLAVCALGSLKVPEPLGKLGPQGPRVKSYEALIERVMAAIIAKGA